MFLTFRSYGATPEKRCWDYKHSAPDGAIDCKEIVCDADYLRRALCKSLRATGERGLRRTSFSNSLSASASNPALA